MVQALAVLRPVFVDACEGRLRPIRNGGNGESLDDKMSDPGKRNYVSFAGATPQTPDLQSRKEHV